MASEITKYKTQDNFWMVTKCTNSTLSDLRTELCENPGRDGTLESITPVSDPSTGVHYRNKHCAFCTGEPVDRNLIRWKIKINNDHYIALPDRNLLTKIREQKGNIFFIPPEYLFVESCKWPTYSITTCNETGLWSEYNETIEMACHAFVDPFNFTYQNYFCFLCNSPAELMPSSNWKCRQLSPFISGMSPPFFAVLDITTVLGDDEEETLVCDSAQIPDYEKVSTVLSLNVGTPSLLTMFVLKFQQVHKTTCWCVEKATG